MFEYYLLPESVTQFDRIRETISPHGSQSTTVLPKAVLHEINPPSRSFLRKVRKHSSLGLCCGSHSAGMCLKRGIVGIVVTQESFGCLLDQVPNNHISKKGLGLRVQGLGLRVQGLGFRA